MRHANTIVRRLLALAGALVLLWVAGLAARQSSVPWVAARPAVEAPQVANAPAVTAPAIPATHARANHRAAPKTNAPAQAGLRAYLDPETGTIGSPPNAAIHPGPAETVIVPAPVEGHATDGSPMLELRGALQEYAVLRIGPDGRRTMRCVPDPKIALEGDPVPVAQPVEE
jgi:hypothetical protein